MKTQSIIVSCLTAVVVQFGFAADSVGALDAVYQWSVEVPRVEQGKPNSRAFLWVPEKCRALKGVVLGSDNMLEEPIFANANFRDALAAANVGIVFVIPGLDSMQKMGAAEKAQIAKMMDDLAAESGYSELSSVKIAAIGESDVNTSVLFPPFSAAFAMSSERMNS